MGVTADRANAWRHGVGRWPAVAGVALLLALARGPAYAGQAAASGPAAGDGQRVSLDRVVAVVNEDLILESDVEDEQRFAAFQPFSEPQGETQEQLVDRLIDRDLIQQQMRLQPEGPITDAQVDEQLLLLRKSIPACATYRCDTEAGWEKFIADHGFTLQEVRDRWRVRMEVLRFIEERFRMGIRITPAEIDDYYKKTMLPTYQKEGGKPPAESTISDRIQEILLQERVTGLLDDWLKTLRAQGSVRVVKPGEEMP
jgi:peptidyl-prolyl cis-trans isomerase SurA